MSRQDLEHLERVQRRVTNVIPEIKQLPYPERMRQLKLPSLVHRQMKGNMIETYKIMQGLSDIPPETLFIRNTNSITRGPFAHQAIGRM